MKPFITLLGHTLPTYTLLTLAGALCAAAYIAATNRGGRLGHISSAQLVHVGILAAGGAFVGAKLLYALTMLPRLARLVPRPASPVQLLQFLLGGMVFYGGLYGCILAVWWYARSQKLPLQSLLAICVPAIPLFHAFGRVGCFLAGCCWGIHSPHGLVYHHALVAPVGIPLVPVQLIEAVCNLCLFALLSRRVRQGKAHHILPLYLGAYAALRFVLEFFRGDAIRGGFLLSTSQWISLFTLVALAIWAQKNPIRPIHKHTSPL